MEIENSFLDDINNMINRLCLESGVISVVCNEVSNYVNDDDDYEDK